jgi:hypothetical protein
MSTDTFSLNNTTKTIPGGVSPLQTEEKHSAAHFVDGDFAGTPKIVTVFTGHGYLRLIRVGILGTNAVKVRDGATVLSILDVTAVKEFTFGIAIQTALILEQTAALGNADLSVEFIQQ